MPPTHIKTLETSALSNSLERVMRQVLAMKQAGDIDQLIRVVWDVLAEQEYDFLSCAFLLIDEEHSWLTSYNVWDEQFVKEHFVDFGPQRHVRQLQNGLLVLSGQTPLDQAPSLYKDAIDAWRQGTVEQHQLSATEIEEIIFLNMQRYGGSFSAETYPIRFHLHIPFAYGVFSLRSGCEEIDQFSETQISFLKRLVEILSPGYARYREFLGMERENTAQRLRAEAQAMRQSTDIIELMGTLWEELQRAGIDFQYMSISVEDDEEDCIHLYSASYNNVVNFYSNFFPVLKKDIVAGVSLYHRSIPRAIWDEHHTDFVGIRRVENEEIKAYVARSKKLWGIKREVMEIPHSFIMVAAPLPQGRIFVAHFQYSPQDPVGDFTPEDQTILETFAEALGLGFTRFFDFQRLERHNRQLQEERALERVRAEILRMEQSSDILRIVRLIWGEVNGLGHDFQRCSISMFDEQRDLYTSYIATRLEDWFSVRPTARNIEIYDDQSCSHFLEYKLSDVGGPFRQDLLEAWRKNEIFQGGLRSARDKEQYADFLRRITPVEVDATRMPDTSFLYVPFKHGVFGGVSFDSNQVHFSEGEIALFRRFAETFSEGYTRFQELRQREVQRGVEQLRAEVASMRQSSDIADVAVLASEQLSSLGVEFVASSFSVINEESQRVHFYAVGPDVYFGDDTNGSVFGEGSQGSPLFSTSDRSIIRDLADIGSPIRIKNIIPGFNFLYATEDLKTSPVLAERGHPPRIVHRDEEETRRELEHYKRRWQMPNYPIERVARSVVRVPFSHGSIVLTHFEPDRFNQRDMDIIAAYADAVSLGFTRFHDFQRLEQRNRELEIERAIGQVQIAVQAMKNSADILPVITLLSQELQSLGLDYSWCTINIVDAAVGKVRVYGTVGPDQLFSQAYTWMNTAEHFGENFGEKILYFSPNTIELLENEDGPFFIFDIPGSQINIANYMSASLDSYYGQLHHIEGTTAFSRSVEEAKKYSEIYKRHWRAPNWPDDLMLRSGMRTPFAGGTIGLSSTHPDYFSEREAHILERFAEAFTLGYTRYLDFRRLEEQNRALEAASRIKSEFFGQYVARVAHADERHYQLLFDGIRRRLRRDFRRCARRGWRNRSEQRSPTRIDQRCIRPEQDRSWGYAAGARPLQPGRMRRKRRCRSRAQRPR